MTDFIRFRDAVNNQFETMKSGVLFKTSVSKEIIWNKYLDSFPDGTDPVFKETTEHDCYCCKSFIRNIGNVVSIVDGKLVSIWDAPIESFYNEVSKELSKLVKSANICDIYLHDEPTVGTLNNIQTLESGEKIQWEHFHLTLPSHVIKDKDDIGSEKSIARSFKYVLLRSLNEITIDSMETVIDLIDQNSLYRGTEHKNTVTSFLTIKREFDKVKGEVEKDIFAWEQSQKIKGLSKVRNTVIGTLLTDISEGKELEQAVAMFESKVAPTNYKRPTAIVSKKMIIQAQDKVKELGLDEALGRRFAVTEDITINNVLFADRTAKNKMGGVFDEMINDIPDKVKNLDKVEEINIEQFMTNVLPKADTIELMVENKHSGNFMSLISPKVPTAKNMFKWNNNFSWTYNGNIADSMKERVKKAGGNVDGVLRFSIQWNDGDDNQNDFDAHCIEPNGHKIFFQNKGTKHPSSGMLDVDIVRPGNEIAVENITWTNKSKMLNGEYHLLVHNFAHNGGTTGFTAEIEYDGKIYSFAYDKELRRDEKVTVAKIKFHKDKGIEFIESLKSTVTSKNIWSVKTNKFEKVTMVMNSPNHWDGNETGNKHYFFIMEGCKNEEKARGFFNEYLREDLTEHRKVFEILGSKMNVESSDEQLSGVGFSSTQKNSVLCRITGSFTRVVKIIF